MLNLIYAGVIREAHWQIFGWVANSTKSNSPFWDEEAYTAMRTAMAIAIARKVPWVGPDHLLEGLLADPSNAASHLIRHLGVSLESVTAIAERTWPVAGGKAPYRGLADVLHKIGVLESPGGRAKTPSMGLTKRLAAGMTQILAQAAPALTFLETEAIAETVRMGHDRTTLTHLLLAALVLEEQMKATGLRPALSYVASCDFVLEPFGIDRRVVAASVVDAGETGDVAAAKRRRAWRTNPRNPPWTLAAARAADVARTLSREGHVGSAHLIYAVLADVEDTGRRILADHAVDPAVVHRQLATRLGI